MEMYWINNTKSCPYCGTIFEDNNEFFTVNKSGAKLHAWTCKKCSKKFIQYNRIEYVDKFRNISCDYLKNKNECLRYIKEIDFNRRMEKKYQARKRQGQQKEKEDQISAQAAQIEEELRKAKEEAAKERKIIEYAEKYRYFYEKYDFGLNDFISLFEIPEYCKEYIDRNYFKGTISWIEVLNEPDLPEKQKRTIQACIEELYRKKIKDKAIKIQQYFRENYTDGDKPLLLDDEQAFAIALDKKRILVSARAGSGKTRVIASKILYLLDYEKVPENSIISLSFNVSVREEVTKRINEKIRYLKIPDRKLTNAKTFHSLAYRCAEEKSILQDKDRYIHILLENMKANSPAFKDRVYTFFREQNFTVDRHYIVNKEQFYDSLRNQTYKTLNNEAVRSLGEKWIADYFFEHGIRYKYEYEYYLSGIKDYSLQCDVQEKQEILKFIDKYTIITDNGIKKRQSIKPDFYLPDYQIVLEHWGIDEHETDHIEKQKFTEKFDISWYDYYSSMQWKRRFWNYPWKTLLKPSQSGINFTEIQCLLETSVVDMKNGREEFESKLEKILRSAGIQPTVIDKEILIERMWSKQVDRFSKMMESFINKYQQHFPSMNLDEFGSYISKQYLDEETQAFVEIGYDVLKEYERTLSAEEKPSSLREFDQNTLDFNQLMLRATQAVSAGACDDLIMPLKYLLVDEYQDFSELFYRFIRAILERNPEIQLFCVGDSWQAINRFMGSDTDYFDNFKKYFQDTYITNITTNYRSFINIIHESNRFMNNMNFTGEPAQHSPEKVVRIEKELIDINTVFIEKRQGTPDYEKDQVIGRLLSGEEYTQPSIVTGYLKKIIQIISTGIKNEDYLILSRTNYFNAYKLAVLQKALRTYFRKQDFSEEETDKIKVRTIHTAKGDEADNVIILEANPGNIPMIHPDNQLYSIFGDTIELVEEDEARLFYVAITRPRKKLFILYDFLDQNKKAKPSPYIAKMS